MEVMIAIAILSMVLIALMSKVHGCIDTARVTEYQNAAREFSKELLAEIEGGLIEGLQNGSQGNFNDRGYPEITYAVGLGESSSVGSNMMSNSNNGEPQRKMYEKKTDISDRRQDYNSYDDPAYDPNSTDPSLSEEPYTRVRVVVNYPTDDPDRTGSFILERMVPTECTQGTSGINKKKEKEEAAEKASADNAGSNTNNNKQNGSNKPSNGQTGGSAASGSSSFGSAGKK